MGPNVICIFLSMVWSLSNLSSCLDLDKSYRLWTSPRNGTATVIWIDLLNFFYSHVVTYKFHLDQYQLTTSSKFKKKFLKTRFFWCFSCECSTKPLTMLLYPDPLLNQDADRSQNNRKGNKQKQFKISIPVLCMDFTNATTQQLIRAEHWRWKWWSCLNVSDERVKS